MEHLIVKNDPTVEVLLSTFNGSLYLSPLLDSLCNQTFKGFSLLTRDDGSSDSSQQIVDDYSHQLRIKRIGNPTGKNIGAMESFTYLIGKSTAEYIAFCDQDDIWECHRLENGVAALNEFRDKNGAIPAAAFSDLSLISATDNHAGASFLEYIGFNPAALHDPYYIAFHNCAPGCSMTINRALATATPPPGDATLMHDWWFMLAASLSGRTIFINKNLVRYRLHTSNTLGIAHDKPLHPLLSAISMFNPLKAHMVLQQTRQPVKQAKALFRCKGKHFSVTLFWLKLIAGRYVFPAVARFWKPAAKYSWKRIPYSNQ